MAGCVLLVGEAGTGKTRALGDHLRRTVRTGFFCSYQPDPHTSVAWTLSDTAVVTAVAARRR